MSDRTYHSNDDSLPGQRDVLDCHRQVRLKKLPPDMMEELGGRSMLQRVKSKILSESVRSQYCPK